MTASKEIMTKARQHQRSSRKKHKIYICLAQTAIWVIGIFVRRTNGTIIVWQPADNHVKSAVPEQKSEWTKVRKHILYKSQNSNSVQKSEWPTWTKVRTNKSQNGLPEQKSEWTKVRMTCLNKSQKPFSVQKSEWPTCTKVRMKEIR